MRGYDVRPDDALLKARSFSGGNQQKLVLAREMEHDPDLLLVGQPTRGVDIGAIEFIHKRLIAMRDAGKAVLLVSVELDEILSLADRILVMFDGTITGELAAADADERRIGLLMAGDHRRGSGGVKPFVPPPLPRSDLDWGELVPLIAARIGDRALRRDRPGSGQSLGAAFALRRPRSRAVIDDRGHADDSRGVARIRG